MAPDDSSVEKYAIDATDIKLLRALQTNARLTVKELAARVNLSTTPVFKRVQRMERDGIIKGYIAVLNAEKLNRGFVVFCQVKMNRLGRDIAADFAKTIAHIPEVTECYNISGQYDYLHHSRCLPRLEQSQRLNNLTLRCDRIAKEAIRTTSDAGMGYRLIAFH